MTAGNPFRQVHALEMVKRARNSNEERGGQAQLSAAR